MKLQKTNNGTRIAAMTAGVALMECGSYVDSHFDSDSYAESIKLASDADALGALKWEKALRALVAKGKHGSLVRFGHVSEDGAWLRYKGADGVSRIIARAVLCEGASIVVLTLAELVEATAKKGDLRVIVQRNNDKASDVKAGDEFAGFIYGNIADSYASLVFAHGGKLHAKDIETKSNDYNEKVLVSLGDVSTIAAKSDALKAKLLAAAGLGEAKEVKDKGEKKVKKTVAAKAAKVS